MFPDITPAEQAITTKIGLRHKRQRGYRAMEYRVAVEPELNV
jgi:hypothetical protein